MNGRTILPMDWPELDRTGPRTGARIAGRVVTRDTRVCEGSL